MSNVNIRRAVENIRRNTNVYMPVVETIVNALQAIDEQGVAGGRVSVCAVRANQDKVDGSLPDVIGFNIEDDGIGFNDAHRQSFDTLYTDRKIAEGGKGFGRFTCLKYFEDLRVESVYREDSEFKLRRFSMGKEHEIIVNESVEVSTKTESRTIVSLIGLKKGASFDARLSTIAKNLTERLLPYFIAENYVCPEIVLSEAGGSGPIRLNEFVSNEVSAFIQEIRLERNRYSLMASGQVEEEFSVRVFKIYAPKNHSSRISLVAHRREVSGSVLHKYVPEFESEFSEKGANEEADRERNYIIKAYVIGSYLDKHVSLERGGFEFMMDGDLIFGIAQMDIEREAASIAKNAIGEEISPDYS